MIKSDDRRTARAAVRGTAAAAALTMVAAGLALCSVRPAFADVLPGNAGDVGVYTDGASDPLSIGSPSYANEGTVSADLAPGVPFSPTSMHRSIFDKDVAAGGTDFYLDRILGVRGTLGLPILQTRGRSLYVRGIEARSFTQMGFAGSAYAGGPRTLGDFYTVSFDDQQVTEQSDLRFNAPSHATTRYAVGSTGVVADQTKLITYDNVALTATTLTNPGTSPVTLTVRAASPIAITPAADADELTGTRVLSSGANNGLTDTPWDTVTIGIKGDGFARDGAELTRKITVAPGGTESFSVVGYLGGKNLPDSEAEFRTYAGLSPAAAVRTGITAFNERYADEVPYIDVPDPAVEKAIVYRWWGERYNSIDANAPGYTYQYPTTVEGSNLYQNSIALTQPMHLQDTKWLRTPYLPYGQILNIGELSGASAFLDSPGHTSWNTHYSQYIGTAGLEAFNVHGGGSAIADRFARYFEGDAVGQLEHYDGDGDNLIAYDSNNMPGNDADAITFGYPKTNASQPGSATIERPESAYVWGAFDAARQLYGIAGDKPAKVAEMTTKGNAVRNAVLDGLWSPQTRMFLAETSYGATAAPTANGQSNPLAVSEPRRIPAKESNLYDVYAENLIPAVDSDDYVDGYRFMTYGDNFPIFPFYTANQYDRTKYDIGGSNNFSNINFTVQYRALRAALRTYDTSGKYLTPEYARKLLDWMAWSIYPDADMRAPNQAEYYSNWNASTKTYGRNNPFHVMLGNMNFAYIEDMGGIQPRSDNLIELDPIDLGYDHFMVNNLRYHDHDVTIVWDPDGSTYGLGAGYSLFLDGNRVAAVDELGGFTYNPNTNTLDPDDGIDITFQATSQRTFPTAKNTALGDVRVVEYLKTAGIDLTEDATNLAASATLSSSYTQQGTRPTPWANFHTPGTGQGPNYTPGAIATTERPVSLAAVTDGSTANEPYWGNYGTTDGRGWVQLDFASAQQVDNVKVWFMSDRHEGGYHEPTRFFVEVPDGAGGWKAVPNQAKTSSPTQAKFNEALFNAVTTDKLRVTFDNHPDSFTAIAEIQVFNSGRDIPAAPNEAPDVRIERTDTASANLRASVTATVTDDGVPYDGDLTTRWSLVSTPDGASGVLSTPNALTTTLQGTAAGDYVVRMTATDGELSTDSDIELTLEPRDTVLDFAKTATITTSGSSPWENPQVVNDDNAPSGSNPNGPGFGWGTFGQENNGSSDSRAASLQYSWDAPVRVDTAKILWYDDGGGISAPARDGWALETSTDGATWAPVVLTNGSTYADAVTLNAFNIVEFEPVTTRYLRVRIYKQARDAGGVGVLRWRAAGDAVDAMRVPVTVRTTRGVAPQLPDTVEATFVDGGTGTIEVTWPTLDPAQYGEANTDPLEINGTNADYGQVVPAEVYVRNETADGGITIVSAEQFTQAVRVGQQPVLPTKVAVSYNDGSRDNQAIGVDWDYDPTVVDEDGTYTIPGALILPRYVGQSGTTTTRLVLTVGDGKTPEAPTDPDVTGPSISISGVADKRTYPATSRLRLNWAATDPSDIKTLQATLDGRAVAPGTFALIDMPRGEHRLNVVALDTLGNRTVRSVSFASRATFGSLRYVTKQLARARKIGAAEQKRIVDLVSSAQRAAIKNRPERASRMLTSVIREARDIRDKTARSYLVSEARSVRRSLR